MAPPGPFEIKLLSARTTGQDPTDEPMLGGALRLTINGVVVADADEFGLERSALALLRTLDRDHDTSRPVGFPRLLIHNCGFPWLACSNFGTDWTVRHDGDAVVIGEVHHFDSHPVIRELSFPGASCRISLSDYRDPIIRFASAVRDAYFAGGNKSIEDPDQRRLCEEFWAEFNELLPTTQQHDEGATAGERTER